MSGNSLDMHLFISCDHKNHGVNHFAILMTCFYNFLKISFWKGFYHLININLGVRLPQSNYYFISCITFMF